MNISPKVKIVFTVDLTLTEEEARALIQLPSYGTDNFINFFYKCLGKTYLEKHENGLRLLFESVNTKLKPLIYRIDIAIEASEKALLEEKP